MLTLNRKAALIGILSAELVLNAALCWPLSKSMGVRGVALATTSAMLISNTALWTIFVRHVGGFSGAAIRARALRTAVVCILSALALAAGHHLLWGAFAIDGTLEILLGCAALGFPFLALYAVLLHAAGLIHVHFEGRKPVVRFPGDVPA
jgi:peptidoglycan biosynthesis protein MviN/MurJ (putative lipid II flippase)